MKWIILWVIIGIACLVLALIGSQTATSEGGLADAPKQPNVDLTALLRDYDKGAIPIEYVVKVLLKAHIEQQGVFLPLSETDTRYDHYYIDKKRHEQLEQERTSRWKGQQSK